MIELLNKPSVADKCSVAPRLVSKLSKPADDAASIFFDATSSASELISRTDSDSRCAATVPDGPSTSMPLRKVPAHSRPCESIDNEEMRLLVSDSRISPQGAKRIASERSGNGALDAGVAQHPQIAVEHCESRAG
jgi:hypothetical protein